MTTTPANLLFCASRALRDAACAPVTTTDHRTEAARLLAPAAPDPIDVVARLLAERDELAAKVRELEDRPVLTAQALAGAISAAHDDAVARWDTDGCRRQGATMTMIAGADVMRHLGPVTLPAQDRAEELARLIAVEPIRTGEWKALVERTSSALASLGAPAMKREVDNTRTAAREKRNADVCTIHCAPLATCGCPHGEGAWIEYRKLWIAARSEVAKLMGDRSAAKPADTVANRAGRVPAEFRDILRAAHNGKRLKLECDSYRDARTLAQHLAAARTYVGAGEANVTIRHRGTLIYLAPRQDSVDIDDADGVLVNDSAPKIKATLSVDDKGAGK